MTIVPSFWPPQPLSQLVHTKTLLGNFFQLAFLPEISDGLCVYEYAITPAPSVLPVRAREALHKSLGGLLSQFMRPTPGKVISPTQLTAAAHCDLGGGVWASLIPVTKLVLRPGSPEFLSLVSALIRRLTDSRPHQRVGRLFFDSSRREDERLQVLSGFSASAGFAEGLGAFLHVDTLYRAVHRKNALETIGSSDSQHEWRRRCENSLVIALHNNRVYRIRSVRFDMTPSSLFSFRDKKSNSNKDITLYDFYRRFYNRPIYDMHQPILEAFPEKTSEKVYLVPELCSLTGLTEEMRKDRMLMQEVLQHSMVSIGDRLNQCIGVATACGNVAASTLTPWGLSLSKRPAEFQARQLEPVEVSFGVKRYTVEDGNFQRHTRHGTHCPVHLQRWIAIYPDSDKSLVDMWLRSMRELGGGGFGMHFDEPSRIVCNGAPEELRALLLDHVTADIQLVMLFTPQKDARRAYETLKQVTCTVRPCISQVVKSETMRKRQSIVAVVTRIVMQISAKLLGPLWHVNFNTIATPMMHQPCMLIGIDTCQSKETRRPVLGFVASLDAYASHYFTTSVLLDDSNLGKPSYVASKIKLCMQDALEAFARHNDGILPTNVVVYRGSVPRSSTKIVGQSEAEAVLEALNETAADTWKDPGRPGVETQACAYNPALTYVLCVSNVTARFFQPSENGEMSSPQPGTVIESALPGSCPAHTFFLINQHVARGTAVPTQYIVAYDSSNAAAESLQNLTYRLSHMYYNFPGAVRLPAPTQYARKLAHLVGTAVQSDVHPRLRETLFYL